LGLFIRRFGGVSSVGFLSYVGEYASYIVVLAFISDKLTINFGLGDFGYLLIGTLSSAYLVGSGLIAVPIGHLSDKFGRRWFAVGGCALGVVGLVSLIFANGVTNLTEFAVGMSVSLCALGIGHGTYTASTLAYTGDIAGKYEAMGKSYGLIEGAEFAGYAFGPALGTTVAFLSGRVTVFEVSASMLLVAAAIAFVSMPEIRSAAEIRSPHAHEHEGVEHDAIESVVDAAGGEEGDPHVHGASWGDYVAAFKVPIISVALLTTFVGSIGFSGFFYYVPLYANSLKGFVPAFGLLYGYFASIMALTAVILMVPIGHIEDAGKRRMPYLAAGLVLGALSLSFVFITASVPSFVIASLAFGFSIAIVRVSQLVILAERSNPSNRAAIMGTNHAVEHAGYGVATLAVGALIAFLGFVGAFRGLSLILLLAGLGFLLYAIKMKVK